MPSTNVFRHVNARLAFVAIFASLGSLSFGYDNGWWGLILGAPYFNEKYGSGVTATGGHTLTASEQSSGTALGTAGIMIGCMISPSLNERFGRKKAFMTLAVVGVLGTLLQATSTIEHGYWHLVVGKIILNISVGIAASCVGVYLSETSPAEIRGFFMGFYTIVQNIGYVTAGATVYGTVLRTDSLCWLLPIVLQFIVPAFILLGTPFLPESPRWLIGKGRFEEAAVALRSLRVKGNDSDAQIQEEIQEIKAAYDEQRQLHSGSSWLELFRGPNLRRTLIAVGVQSLQQGQGVSFLSNYLVILFLQIGIQNVYVIILVLYVVLFVCSLGGMYTADKFGRRTLLLVGAGVQTACMAVLAAVATVEPAPKGALANLMIASIFIWVAFFSCTWSPINWTLSSEISSNPLREKTLALAAWAGFAVGLIVGFITPYIQAKIGGQIGFLWMSISFVSLVWTFFQVPETNGRSLEELDYMFEIGVPTRQFSTYDTSALMASKLAAVPVVDNKKSEREYDHQEYKAESI